MEGGGKDPPHLPVLQRDKKPSAYRVKNLLLFRGIDKIPVCLAGDIHYDWLTGADPGEILSGFQVGYKNFGSPRSGEPKFLSS